MPCHHPEFISATGLRCRLEAEAAYSSNRGGGDRTRRPKVHGLTPRHRRKAGSGPPATALIAWIETDPHLRNATAATSHRRETDIPPPADTRTARAAVAACFVLVCGAVLGITAAISDGLVLPLVPPQSRQPAALDRDPAAASVQETSPMPLKGGPGPVASPAPVAMGPMIIGHQAPQSLAVPRASGHIDHTDAGDGGRQGSVLASSPPAPSPRRTVKSGNSDKSIDTVEPRDTGAPATTGTPASPGKPVNAGPPVKSDKSGDSSPPASSAVPGGADKPRVVSKPGNSGGKQGRSNSTVKSIDSRGAGDAGARSGSRADKSTAKGSSSGRGTVSKRTNSGSSSSKQK